MTTQYWLVKSEPSAYSWTDLLRDRAADWTGVRNYAARNHLRAMRPGDAVFFYHSVEEKAVVGLARVSRPAFPDPTAEDDTWTAVTLEPVAELPSPVTLARIKTDRALATLPLLRQSRLSVMPLTAAHAARLRQLGGL